VLRLLESGAGDNVIALRLLGLLALVTVNGFFAAVEFSLVRRAAFARPQLMEAGDPRARIVLDLLGHLDRVVSGVQVGITLTSLGLGALGEAMLAGLLSPLVANIPGSIPSFWCMQFHSPWHFCC